MAEALGRKWFAERLGVNEAELLSNGYLIRSGGLSYDYEPEGRWEAASETSVYNAVYVSV
jgi:hypothetical protein